MFRSHRGIRPVSLAALAAAALALAACAPQPGPTTTPRPSSASPAPTSTPPSATPTPTPSEEPTPVAIACDRVVTPQQLYDFNPNFGSNPGYAPAAGSPAATAVAERGVACSWLNQTSRATVDVSVARPAAGRLAALRAAAGASTDLYGAEGHFAAAGGRGVAQVFANGYWVTVSSEWFEQPGDAAKLVEDVLGNLP